MLSLLATLACGHMGGFFFAFSVVVMRALAMRLGGAHGALVAEWWPAVPRGNNLGNDAVQCAEERSAEALVSFEQRRYETMGGLSRDLDCLEPRTRAGGDSRRGLSCNGTACLS